MLSLTLLTLVCVKKKNLVDANQRHPRHHEQDVSTKKVWPVLRCKPQPSVILISVVWQNDDGGMGDDASDALTRFSCFQCCCCVSTYSTLCALMFCFFIPCVCFNVTYLCMSPVSTCAYPRMRTWHAMACIHIYSIVYACTYFLYVYSIRMYVFFVCIYCAC